MALGSGAGLMRPVSPGSALSGPGAQSPMEGTRRKEGSRLQMGVDEGATITPCVGLGGWRKKSGIARGGTSPHFSGKVCTGGLGTLL